ncbi:MAG: discoidin domain-containing protein [Myxococcota bacterium]
MRTAVLLGVTALIALPAQAGFRVSSFRQVGKSTQYSAAAAIDDNGATAWQTDPESEQVGEWIEIDLPKSEVDKIGIMVGWEKTDESWKDYGRLAQVRLELYSEGDDDMKRVMEKTIDLEDKKGMQYIDIDDTKVGSELGGGKVKLIVTKITAGDDYPSIAVGEVKVLLKEMDATAVFVGEEPAAMEGKDAMAMLDGNARTYFVGAEGEMPTFAVEAQGWGVSSLVVTPGPKPYARPKKIEITCANKTKVYDVADTNKPQTFALPSIVGYSGSAWGLVNVKVLESYEGTKPGVALAEVAIKATNFDGL